MNVAIASSGLGHIARGVESWASDLGHALADRGEQVLLCKGAGTPDSDYERVIPCWTRESARTLRTLRFMPRRLGWRLGLGSAYEIEQSTFAARLIGVLRREQVDLLHVQDPHVALLIHQARRFGLVRTRTILAHGTEEPAEFLDQFDYVQHLAPWHMEQARVAGAWKPSWTSIPNFIDLERFMPGRSIDIRSELGLKADDLVVLSAAAISRNHKRTDHLLNEFAALLEARPDLPAYLVVAGGWEKDTDDLVAYGRRLLGDRVRFLVRFPRDRMPDLYRAADAFVLCSLVEMMGIVLIEAAATGVPCLVHDHPVLRWVVGPGGESIDMSRPGELTRALGRWLGDSSRRADLGEKARSWCVENFSRERVVSRILDYYRFVLSGSASPPEPEASLVTVMESRPSP